VVGGGPGRNGFGRLTAKLIPASRQAGEYGCRGKGKTSLRFPHSLGVGWCLDKTQTWIKDPKKKKLQDKDAAGVAIKYVLTLVPWLLSLSVESYGLAVSS